MKPLTVNDIIGVDQGWIVAEINGLRDQLAERDARIAELKEQLAADQVAEEPPEEQAESPPTPTSLAELDNFASELRTQLRSRRK